MVAQTETSKKPRRSSTGSNEIRNYREKESQSEEKVQNPSVGNLTRGGQSKGKGDYLRRRKGKGSKMQPFNSSAAAALVSGKV
jgi:hypothetical protein